MITFRFRKEENATPKQFCEIFALIFRGQEHKETKGNEK